MTGVPVRVSSLKRDAGSAGRSFSLTPDPLPLGEGDPSGNRIAGG